MSYVQGIDREQSTLFPAVVDDYISAENPIRFIDAFVGTLDLVALGFTHAVLAETGRSPYHPADMIKLFLYGYLNKIRSSRELERATHRNVEVFWLLRMVRPDHKTISTFRKQNLKPLKGVSRAFTQLCKDMDLFSGELIAIDGSKFAASNHNSRAFTRAKLKKIDDAITKAIDAYYTALERTDAQGNPAPPPDAEGLQTKIDSLKQRQQKVAQLRDTLEASGQTQVVLSDPDSRMMSASTGRRDVSYNVQIAVDAKHGLIVAHDVSSDCNDEKQLSSMAMKAKAELGTDDLLVVADTGYYNENEIAICHDRNITCMIAPPNKSQNARKGMFTDRDFSYDPEQNCYHCPARQILTPRGTRTRGPRIETVYSTRACSGCALRSHCTESKRDGRRIYRWTREELIEAMRTRLKQNPEMMKKRAQLAEHPFGTLKHIMNQGYLLLRGKRKVRTEIAMSVMAFNMKRVLNIVGVPKLLAMLKYAAMQVPIRAMKTVMPHSPCSHQETVLICVGMMMPSKQFFSTSMNNIVVDRSF